jgi:peptide/nickel transport system substrate-binding protein
MRRAALLALSVLVGLGCQDGTESSSSPRSSRLTAREQFTSAVISDPKTFNPVIVVDEGSRLAVEFIFEGMVRTNPVSLEPEPWLAERWEHDAEGTTWTFHLRRDVVWHDGTPFTAADVAFTFKVVFDERVANSAKYVLTVDGEPIRVEAVDDHTVRVVTKRPFAPLLSAIGVEILPAHVLGEPLESGTFAQTWGIDTPPEQLIGTGPYKMIQYVPAQFMKYVRNERYWGKDASGAPLPYLETRTTLIVPNMDTAYLKFVAGEMTVHAARPEEVSDLQSKAERMRIKVEEIGLDSGTVFVALNRNPRYYERDGKRDPRLDWFEDLRFRRALAHAIDKQAIIVSCLNGHGRPAVGLTSPANPLFHNPNLEDYEYDLDRSRRLLQEAGFKDSDGDGFIEDAKGNTVEFTLTTNSGNQIREKMCSILKEDWTKIGLKVAYRPLDFNALVERLNSTFEWDAVLIGFTGSPEPNNGANLLRSDGNLHLWNPSQPKPATAWEAEIDALLDEGSRILEPEKRRAPYWRIQEILHRELPFIQMVRQIEWSAYHENLEGYRRTVWGVHEPEKIRFRTETAAVP